MPITNQTLLHQLSSAYMYFKQKESVYISIQSNYQLNNQMIKKCEKSIMQNKFVTIALFALYLWKPYGFIIENLNQRLQTVSVLVVHYLEKLSETSILVSGVIALIVVTVFYALPIALFFLLRYVLIKFILWAKITVYKPKLLQRIQLIENSIDELTTYYQSFKNMFNFDCPISFNYSSPESIKTISQYVENGRADTVKEALNLMHEDEHQKDMLDLQNQILGAAQETAYYAKSAAASARWAAWNTFFR